SRTRARFALWGWIAEPGPAAATLPRGIGSMALAPPFAGGRLVPNATWNNFDARLGAPTRASLPAPSIAFDRATGARNPATVVLQGLIEDDASSTPDHVSVTNAIVLRIR